MTPQNYYNQLGAQLQVLYMIVMVILQAPSEFIMIIDMLYQLPYIPLLVLIIQIIILNFMFKSHCQLCMLQVLMILAICNIHMCVLIHQL